MLAVKKAMWKEETMKNRVHQRLALTLSLASFVLGTAAGLARADEIKMGYINKMGEHPWFVSEGGGAKSEEAKRGVKLMSQDVQFNFVKQKTAYEMMVGDGVKAIAIVVPDRA